VEFYVAGIARFQMRLVDQTSFKFVICLDPMLSAEQRGQTVAATQRRLREFLDQKLMQNVNFEVVVADDIPLDPKTRKFKLIVDERAE
jgi:hypothetical protein